MNWLHNLGTYQDMHKTSSIKTLGPAPAARSLASGSPLPTHQFLLADTVPAEGTSTKSDTDDMRLAEMLRYRHERPRLLGGACQLHAANRHWRS